jgi:prophage regulatory protein
MALSSSPLSHSAIASAPAPLPSRSRVTGEFTDRLLDIKDVRAKLKISKSKIYALMATGQFPRPMHPGPQMARWLESIIDDWIDGLEVRSSSVRH